MVSINVVSIAVHQGEGALHDLKKIKKKKPGLIAKPGHAAKKLRRKERYFSVYQTPTHNYKVALCPSHCVLSFPDNYQK